MVTGFVFTLLSLIAASVEGNYHINHLSNIIALHKLEINSIKRAVKVYKEVLYLSTDSVQTWAWQKHNYFDSHECSATLDCN